MVETAPNMLSKAEHNTAERAQHQQETEVQPAKKNVIGRVVLSLFVISYPLLVYFGLIHLAPRVVALLVVAAGILRLLAGRIFPAASIGLSSSTLPWLLALSLGVGYTLLSGSVSGLLFYPVLVNAVLFIFFMFSWFNPPSVIERLARLREPDLPPAGVRYTRKVTLVWAGFFVVNGSIAAAMIPLGHSWWALYNGVISYVLMGTLFLAEWMVRQRVRRDA